MQKVDVCSLLLFAFCWLFNYDGPRTIVFPIHFLNSGQEWIAGDLYRDAKDGIIQIVVLVISKAAGEKEKNAVWFSHKVEQNNFKFSTHAKKIKIKIITNAVFNILRVCITRKFNTNGQIFAFFIIVGTTALFISCILSSKLLKPIKTRGSCHPLIWWIFFFLLFLCYYLGVNHWCFDATNYKLTSNWFSKNYQLFGLF